MATSPTKSWSEPGTGLVTVKSYNLSGQISSSSSVATIANFRRKTFQQTSSKGNFVNPTPHSFIKTSAEGVSGSLSEIRRAKDAKGNWYVTSEVTRSGALAGISAASTVPPYGLTSAAYNQALAKLNDAIRGDLDWSINAFESAQTARMAETCFNVLQNVTGRNAAGYLGKALKNAPANLSSAWLMAQYGLFPLYKDLYATAEKLSSHCAQPLRFMAQGKAKDVKTSVTGSGTYTYASISSTSTYSCRCELGVELSGTKTLIQEASEWTSLNPASIAWELTPYSFCVDWLINIGGYLRDLETGLINRGRFARGYKTTTELSKLEQTYSVRKDLLRTEASAYQISGYGVSEYRVKNREVLIDYPLPDLPVFRPKLGWQRLLSAASLMTQAITKHRSRK